MTALVIADLPLSTALDRKAMASVVGGWGNIVISAFVGIALDDIVANGFWDAGPMQKLKRDLEKQKQKQ
jgi:hypothetical protein